VITESVNPSSCAPTAKIVRTVLNAGSGGAGASPLHPAFPRAAWKEVRLDIDAAAKPDIVGSLGNMRGLVADQTFDAIWSSHSLEHLHAHEVLPALGEFRRILRPDGFAIVGCPDLIAIARFVLETHLEAVAYESKMGPIRPLDMIYGHEKSIAAGSGWMAHRTGFTSKRLGRLATEAGFVETRVVEADMFDLWALLLMPEANDAALAEQFKGTNLATLAEAPGPTAQKCAAA